MSKLVILICFILLLTTVGCCHFNHTIFCSISDYLDIAQETSASAQLKYKNMQWQTSLGSVPRK